MKTWQDVEFKSIFPPRKNRIVGMTFPRQDATLGLEPSILYVLPPGRDVEYDPENGDYNDDEVRLYLCSVYISGLDEFNAWKQRHNRAKIVVGGYHPTSSPEDFPDVGKVVTGPCDGIFATLEKPGRVVEGVLGWRNTPRRDLYDPRRYNQQIIPDKKPGDLVLSISTSFGCPMRPPCDFCCTPLMCPRLESKPLPLLEKELREMVDLFPDPKFLFIRDENFSAQRDWQSRLEMIHRKFYPDAKLYLFASANTIDAETASVFKDNGVYMVCMGMENVDQAYRKNARLDEVVGLLKRKGIYTYLSFIVNPLEVVGRQQGEEFYARLTRRLHELKPEMICGNFLMPFRGTGLWDKYYHLVSREDYAMYNSKEPFLVRNETLREKMRFFMFWYQWLYYTSDTYNSWVRTFACGDTLHLRFLELQKRFEKSYRRCWNTRP